MSIKNFIEHDARGLDIPEDKPFNPFDPLDERSKFYPGVMQICRVSWLDRKNVQHEIDTSDFFVRVLPDRSGLICVESHKSTSKYRDSKITGAFVLNEDGSLRYRLEVPVELTNRDIPPDASRSFAWIEQKESGDSQYGLTARIEYAGQYYFELDYRTGKFLWGRAIRF